MDDCGDGFKELVASHLGSSLLWRLRHRLFFVVVTCLGKRMCMQDPRRAVCKFQTPLTTARLPNVPRHAFRPQLQGYECPGRLGGEVWCGSVHTGRSVDVMLARLARPCPEPRHRFCRAAASSREGLVPQECSDDLPSNAAIQLGGQQGSDH